jgi:hypothetical protein
LAVSFAGLPHAVIGSVLVLVAVAAAVRTKHRCSKLELSVAARSAVSKRADVFVAVFERSGA